ncbi:transcriptional regulator [Flammeovirgaceae bacterium 311]|nr:transcriptional regulator [Flammeovirgaceae bacterium 311]
MMEIVITPIISEEDYQKTLEKIDSLLEKNPQQGTDEYYVLDALTTLVQKYEEVHYPVPDPDPIEYLKFVMEQRGLKPKDLVEYIGPKSRVSEILNRKRYFTLDQVYNLWKGLNIPLDVLVTRGKDIEKRKEIA